MSTMKRADAALERFKKIRGDLQAAASATLNESDTRFQIIDRLLIDVLGWHRKSIRTEDRASTGYLDYLLLNSEGRGSLVVEAKRVGLLAPKSASDDKTSLRLSGTALKPLSSGVDQAMGYAAAKGVGNAVVTDGVTWLFFKASRTDGTPPLEGAGVLFPTLDSIERSFIEFYELLSAPGVDQRLNEIQLRRAEGKRVALAEQQYVASPADQARLLSRNPLAADAQLLFKQFFSRLTDDKDREMLRECFVETAESRRADVDLQKILQKLANAASQIDTEHGRKLQAEIEQTIETGRSESVLLVGNKGAGKSTFVDRFFEVVLPPALKLKCIVARVDVSKHSGGQRDKLLEWVIVQLRDQLEAAVCTSHPPSYDDLQGVFWDEYQRWMSGPYKALYDSDKTAFKIKFGEHMEQFRSARAEEYTKLLLHRAFSGVQRLPCVVLDNTDQFSTEIQDAVYQLAHALGADAPVLSIVPITDRAVWRLSKAGALQSYPAKMFYLPNPEAKQILSRRVAFVKVKLSQEPEAAKAYFSRKGFSVSLDNLNAFAEAIERVFVQADFVSRLIGMLGNYDIRRMLELSERVFMSPEIKIDEVLRAAFGGPSVTSNLRRTHRAVIKGEYDRYSELENSYVLNTFWTDPENPATPLLALYVLAILQARLSRPDDGSVEALHWRISDLASFLEPCGVDPAATITIVQRLFERRLVEPIDPSLEEVGEQDLVAIKESGQAHLELMLESDVYLEQMALATGVNKSTLRDEFRALVKNATRDSFSKIRILFVKYLTELDAGRLRIPPTKEYTVLRDARSRFTKLVTVRPPTGSFRNRKGHGRRASPRPNGKKPHKRRR